jgi:hypothetical protein
LLGLIGGFLKFDGVLRLLVLSFMWLPALCSAQVGSHLQLIGGMLDSIKAIKTLRFTVLAVEKVGDTYLKAISENKINIKPRKLYFINREKKLEILYDYEQNQEKAVVKPHVFPYVTMSLSPTGSLMRKNQHYTINELGFEFIGRSIAIALSKQMDNFSKCITYYGKHDKNGYKCHLFVYETKSFPYTDYVVKEKETVTSIALRLNLNDYMIRYKNNLINEFDYLRAGTKLKIPVYYCKKVVLFIDDRKLLPVSLSVFDDSGLLESYDFSNIIVNQPFDAKEFSKEYKDYHF